MTLYAPPYDARAAARVRSTTRELRPARLAAGMGVIYRLVDLAQGDDDQFRTYIGATKVPHQRYRKHINDALRGKDSPIYRWMRRVFDAGSVPVLEVIECVPLRELQAAERNWIA